MLEAKLDEGLIFKKIVDAIKDLVKQVNIDASSTGLFMQAMDSSHVALVSLELKESGFQSFRCDKLLTLGLQIDHLQKILKVAGNDDSIRISAEEEEPSQLKFEFESKSGGKVSEFHLNLINMDSEQLGIPETEYTSVVTLPSAEFTRICKELSAISETMAIETSKESVKFSVAGEVGQGSVTIKQNDGEKDDKTILEVDEPVNLSFALRYLNMFNKSANLSGQVKLSMSSDTPLVVEYKIDSGNNHLGSLKFYLAPKINDEENQ